MAAFAICETCGDVMEFSDPGMLDRLGAWGAQNGFAAIRTTIEIRGRCSRCINFRETADLAAGRRN